MRTPREDRNSVKTRIFSVRLTEELRSKLSEIARGLGIRETDFLRWAIIKQGK